MEQSYSAQKTILEVQKASEVESLELQEFLQAEKSTLTDSLKDTEQEVNFDCVVYFMFMTLSLFSVFVLRYAIELLS